ncbi:CheR family methyltransferase [Venatoribacter cucullus]|uniref:protein-glutamate O-methyltransferase n=1 Tax=Venatoribacter cucullus TaxID=2661630 RepID=A0A9E8FRF3_9GAMM|nr:CheR family methyltransferase [Venatoribacter cucullus]QQD22550.1 protein-glutamate O-methyltransferase CheR [Oceanospirillaceae bacterium ASx5O]QQD25178.1 protein-glutamate O-methyltransferase CheR [Venatoribacter cucullus]UZK04568.1 protein-glutamate O-methyltransferase CheR [Venatoribacter cucullus]
MNQPLRAAMSAVPELDDTQFLRWQSLLEERTGMCLASQRRSFLQTSLGLRMREVGCDSYEQYYERITAGPSGAIEWTTLVDRLTVQETRFFRDPDAFAFVEQYVQQKATELGADETLEFWSVGCSSGEEAYSLAMVGERFLTPAGKRYAVTGTDISTIVLRKARAGRYLPRALQWVPQAYAAIGFKPQQAGEPLQINDELRQRSCFSQVNILNLAACPLQSQHVIYCQNVLIYFRRWRRREILNVLAERLAPGGILVIGLGEMVDYQHPLLEQIHSSRVSAFVRKKTNSEGESARR